MNNTQTVLLVITIAIIVIAAIAKVIKLKSEKKKFDPNEFLEGFVDELLDFASISLDLLMMNRDKYKTEEEFNDALISSTSRKFRKFIITRTNILPGLENLITDEVCEEFVRAAIKLYQKELFTKKGLNDDTVEVLPDEKEEEAKLEQNASEPVEKVNIIDSINTYEKE